ncbi:hypothetical protein L3081_22175 [Colwellia sp. MSW7]|uniref:2-oxoglutarate-dependent ethylene/succinate-forming enzyme n=1 Tax=Colwellia maritima TaxID=2912588 RepID=A0ABS9X5V6_9GAMM|nr:2OG-Fe(II) oxygenase family protein [Colwellia maritima]MCI2285594.1 hypothetical protein [Colwellia maritima]
MMQIVPTIDISSISNDDIKAIKEACIDHGFFKIKGHGLNTLIDKMWQQAETFFKASRPFKQSLRRPKDGAFGYFDSELTQHKRDIKEVFDYAPKAVPLFDDSSKPYWPDNKNNQLVINGLNDFQGTLNQFYIAQTKLAQQLMEILCQTLGEPPETLNKLFGDLQTSTARLNHYPSEDPIPENERDNNIALNDVALGAHTDPSAITLLLQDDIGGLQAYSAEHKWIDVTPEKYCFIINIGDIVQVWSNGRYKAAIHRVVKVPVGKARFSIPFFYMPQSEAVIKPIISGEKNKFREFLWSEYIKKRIADNYEKTGDKDMQVTDFMFKSRV